MRAGRQRFDNNTGGSDLFGGGTITGNLIVNGTAALNGDTTVGGAATLFLTPFGGGTPSAITTFAGDPNGTVTAAKGSIIMDKTNGKAWVNTTGAQVWVAFSTGGASGPLFGTVLAQFNLVDATGTDIDLGGAFGQVTYCPFTTPGANYHIGGISNHGVAMAAGQDGIVLCLHNIGGFNALVDINAAASNVNNRLGRVIGHAQSQLTIDSALWMRYNGTALKWESIVGYVS